MLSWLSLQKESIIKLSFSHRDVFSYTALIDPVQNPLASY